MSFRPLLVPLLPLAPGELGVWLELEAASSDSAAAWFVRLPGDSPHTRCLRGAVVSASGLVLAPVVVKLRQDQPVEGFFPEEEVASLDPTHDEWWARTLANLGRLQGDPPCVPELVLPAADASPLPMLPPLVFCGLSRRLFRFFCPSCLGPLITCRDNAALAAAGLPPFSPAGPHVLVCPHCPEDGRKPRLWASSDIPELPSSGLVGSWHELQQAWLEAAARLAAADDRPEAVPPCITCGMAEACLGKASQRGSVSQPARSASSQPLCRIFLPSESPYIVTRLAQTSFETFADRLGGRSDVSIPGLPSEGGFIFGDEGAGLDAVEVLTLKLVLFLQVVQCVREYHRRLGLPHLDVHPDHIVVDCSSTGELLPALWSLRARLLGPSAARVAELASGASVLLPPPEVKVPFAAPRVREFSVQARRRAELLIERVVAEPDGSGRSRLEAVLRDPHGLHLRPSLYDWLLLTIPDGEEELGIARLPVRSDPRRASAAGSMLHVTSEPLLLAPAVARRLAQSGGLHLPLVRYRVYPQFTDCDDAFSLGVLLLRLLLVNDAQDLATVTNIVADTVQRATTAAPAPVRSGAYLVESAFSAAAAAFPAALAKSNLFYRHVDRVAGRPHAVPDALWRGALLLAFRLLEMGLAPVPQATAVEPARLAAVAAEGTQLLRQLQAVLFRRQGLNLEIQAIIEELAASDPAKQH